MVVALIAAATYAATTLQVSNTATITAGNPNLLMVTGVTASTTCSGSTGTYTDTGLSISWGSLVQGSTANQYVCLENTGSPHTLSITNSLPTADGTITATINGNPASGQTLGHGAFALVTFAWIVDSSAPLTTSLSFNISVS